jgi:hypothetical protein
MSWSPWSPFSANATLPIRQSRALSAHEPRSSGAAQVSSRQVTLVEAGDAVLARGF